MAYVSEMAFLFARGPKVKKPRAARKPSIKVGMSVMCHGRDAVIVERDNRFKDAWFISIDGIRAPLSFSRDMIVFKAAA